MKLNKAQEDAIVAQIDYLIKEPTRKRNDEIQKKRSEQYMVALAQIPQVKEYVESTTNGYGSTSVLDRDMKLKPYLERKFPEIFERAGILINYNEVLQSIRREAIIFSATAKSVEEILNKLVTKYYPS